MFEVSSSFFPNSYFEWQTKFNERDVKIYSWWVLCLVKIGVNKVSYNGGLWIILFLICAYKIKKINA